MTEDKCTPNIPEEIKSIEEKKKEILPEKDIFPLVDHTLLSPTATWEQIQDLMDQAQKASCASVCIPPIHLKQAKEYWKSKGYEGKLCTVIAFPLGYQTTETKCFECKDALEKGADEIDMVIQQAWVKEKKFKEIEEEIRKIKALCQEKILKVIIETCYLNEEEILEMTRVVEAAGADFIKTSTGFGIQGATVRDIALFKKARNEKRKPLLRIKAAGGMKSREDVLQFLALGVDRLGTSKAIKLFTELGSKEDNTY